jgi:DNA-directed RNA polymerase specialized sigma24 family protein
MDDSKKAGTTQGRGRRQAGVAAEVTRAAAPTPALPDAAEEPLLDPRDAATQARLRERTATGGYAVPETSLVRAIRGWKQHGDAGNVRALCTLLIERCTPEFQRRAWGLRHRPDLMEEAIAGMIEQVLREAQDPSEIFMTQNFIHYLRCCAADNFNRVLRQEGLSYRRDEQGRPAGRPQHVPAALVDRIDAAAEDREEEPGAAPIIADPRDGLEERMAAVEAQRILGYLPDPLDRQIMSLRALEHMRWDDIAKLCGKTERTMRLRYEKAIVILRQRIEAEVAVAR